MVVLVVVVVVVAVVVVVVVVIVVVVVEVMDVEVVLGVGPCGPHSNCTLSRAVSSPEPRCGTTYVLKPTMTVPAGQLAQSPQTPQ